MEQQITPEMLQVPKQKRKFESESVANVILLYLGGIKKRFCNKFQLISFSDHLQNYIWFLPDLAAS